MSLKQQLAAAIALAALLILSFKFNLVLLLLKLFVDNFALGISGTKVQLLLAFLLTLTLSYRLKLAWKDSYLKPLLSGVLLLHILCLLCHLYFCRTNQLPLLERTVCVNDGLQSAGRLQHIHASKAVLANLLSYTGQGFDLGRPYLAVFPSWWLHLHSVFFLVLLLGGFLWSHNQLRTKNWGYSICSTLVVFTLLKNGLDGGPLDGQSIAAVPFLFFLLGWSSRVGLGLTGGLLLLTMVLSGPKLLVYDIWRFSTACIAFSAPLLAHRVVQEKRQLLLLPIALSLLFGPLLQTQMKTISKRRVPNSPYILQYAFSSIEKDWIIHVVSNGVLKLEKHSLFEIASVRKGDRLYLYRLKILKTTTPLAICDVLGLPIVRRPLVWYSQPVYVRIAGPAHLPTAAPWQDSPLVQAYLTRDRELYLQLHLGGASNIAVDAFGKEFYAARYLGTSYEKPFPNEDWQEVSQ